MKAARDIRNRLNIMINSNYENCGNLFTNQSRDFEMFRRFRILRKQPFKDIEDKNYIYKKLKDPQFVFSLVQHLKTLPELSYEEITSDSLYMKQLKEHYVFSDGVLAEKLNIVVPKRITIKDMHIAEQYIEQQQLTQPQTKKLTIIDGDQQLTQPQTKKDTDFDFISLDNYQQSIKMKQNTSRIYRYKVIPYNSEIYSSIMIEYSSKSLIRIKTLKQYLELNGVQEDVKELRKYLTDNNIVNYDDKNCHYILIDKELFLDRFFILDSK